MSTKQTDAHWESQHQIIEDFHKLIADGDIVEADQMLAELEDRTDDDVHPETYNACHNLLKQEYDNAKEENREDLLTLKQKHE